MTAQSPSLRFFSALLPVFLLGGRAALAAPSEEPAAGVFGNRILEILNSGGEVMWVILGVSILGVALILEAAFRTRRARILPGKVARRLESGPADDDIRELLDANCGASVHRIIQVAHRWRKGTGEQVQAAIEETVDEALWRLKRSLRPIGVLANTAPLLGLLGTVIGIIRAFEVVAEKGALGDPAKLAGGISQALLTTCFGLIVAIPMLLAYHYFTGKAESLLRRAEELVKEALILPPE